MKNSYWKHLSGGVLITALLLSSCRPAYEITQVKGTCILMDTTWDAKPDTQAIAILKPYKEKVNQMMGRVVGTAQLSMDRMRPESLLSNLVADVLRQSATDVLGKPADVGLINIGGIRNSLTKGPLKAENIYEVLPFENSLCVLTLKGTALKLLFENIAAKGGEGVSGIELTINKDLKLLRATIAGQPVEDEQLYTLATIDYLADGNDGMTACLQAQTKVCPKESILRNLFMQYVERQTAAGKEITSRLEGRISVE